MVLPELTANLCNQTPRPCCRPGLILKPWDSVSSEITSHTQRWRCFLHDVTKIIYLNINFVGGTKAAQMRDASQCLIIPQTSVAAVWPCSQHSQICCDIIKSCLYILLASSSEVLHYPQEHSLPPSSAPAASFQFQSCKLGNTTSRDVPHKLITYRIISIDMLTSVVISL